MINTQMQPNNFSPFVIDVKNGRLDSQIKTDTRVSPDYFKFLSGQIQKQILNHFKNTKQFPALLQ